MLLSQRPCLRSGRVGRDHRSSRHADPLPLRKARGLAESFLPQPAERPSETQITRCGEGCRVDQKRGTRGTHVGPRRDAGRCWTPLFGPLTSSDGPAGASKARQLKHLRLRPCCAHLVKFEVNERKESFLKLSKKHGFCSSPTLSCPIFFKCCLMC